MAFLNVIVCNPQFSLTVLLWSVEFFSRGYDTLWKKSSS